ncbi:MAG: type II toxin-antitoxin system RelE family toxin [Nitrospiraceae bacterium]
MRILVPDIPPHVASVIRRLPPDIKQGIKAALRALVRDPHQGRPLLRELEGYWKYRVRRFRVVYAIDQKKARLRIIAVGHRKRIYEDLAEEIRSGRSSS